MTDRVLEIDALLIRHEAAMRSMRSLSMSGEDLLAWVVIPSEDFYNASLAEAKRRGPSAEAKILARRLTESGEDAPRKKRAPQLPRRLREGSRTVSIEELAEIYAA